MSTTGRNEPCPCGSGKKYKFCCGSTNGATLAKSNTPKLDTAAMLKMAMHQHQMGGLSQARSLCEQILHVDRNEADALHLLGLITHQQGNNNSAIECIRKAIQIKPTEPLYYGNLAYLLKLVGRLDEAINCYQQEIAVKPDWADTHNSLGSVLRAQGRLVEAEQSYLRAIELHPNYAEATSNLGNVYLAQGRVAEAIAHYKKALIFDPHYAQAHSNIGKAYLELNQLDDAEQSLRQAIATKPDLGIAQSNLGKVLLLQGKLEQAYVAYRQCEPGTASNSILVKYAFQLPAVMGTKTDVLLSRARLEQCIERLGDTASLDDPIKQGCASNFYLAFHGENDKPIQEKIASFYAKACPGLLYVAPHCTTNRVATPRTKIGFISQFIYTHSVSLSFGHIVKAINQNAAFEVTLISAHDRGGAQVEAAYADFKGKHLQLSKTLATARSQVAALELDVLVYLDIGMEPLGYFLAYARLAPVQCVLGGHPVTTGIANIDYYLSSDLAEPVDANSHYSEKLIRLPFGAFYFERPTPPAIWKTRGQLGMPEGCRVYVCPMTLQKIHPDFDEAVARILELDPEGRVVFFEDRSAKEWKVSLEKRFRQTINYALRDRILFLPWVVDATDFSSLIAESDVVLDSFHFGIGTTAITTCSVGTPFVTRPGAFLRGRVGLFYCKLLDVMECVVHTTEEYAQRAVEIAQNSDVRGRLKTKLLANNHKLFSNEQGVRDVVDFLSKLNKSEVHQ